MTGETDTTTPKGATDTFAYQQAAQALSQVEEILGNQDDAAKYRTLATSVAEGFHSLWFNSSGGFAHYCTNSQACNALALDMGAVPAANRSAVLTALIDSLVNNSYHVTVGEIGLPSLIRVLQATKKYEVLYQVINSRTAPSYGYEVSTGATTLWEHWDGAASGGSLNHFMYGYGDLWLLQLSGLAQQAGSVGWKSINYKPTFAGDLTSASTSYRTPTGVAAASWTLNGKKLTYDITVPVGSTGLVYLNGTSATEGGNPLQVGQNGITSVQTRCQWTLVGVGSGNYSFQATRL